MTENLNIGEKIIKKNWNKPILIIIGKSKTYEDVDIGDDMWENESISS